MPFPATKTTKRTSNHLTILDTILSNQKDLLGQVRQGAMIQAKAKSLFDEVESPYMLSKDMVQEAPFQPDARFGKRCKNPLCKSTTFELDSRGGNEICSRCGVVQNCLSIASLEEEHRTFADDTDSDNKKRAEVQKDLRPGGLVPVANLKTVQQALSENKEENTKGLEIYQKIVRDLAGIIQNNSQDILDVSSDNCDRFVKSVIAHRGACRDTKCHLFKFQKDNKLVAAGLLLHTMRQVMGRGSITFAALVKALHEYGMEKATASQINHTYQVVMTHLQSYDNNQCYPCCSPETEVICDYRPPEDTQPVACPSLVGAICAKMKTPPPYAVNSDADALIDKWTSAGAVPSLQPRTISACAIVIAYEASLQKGASSSINLDERDLIQAAEIDQKTLEQGLRALRAVEHGHASFLSDDPHPVAPGPVELKRKRARDE